MTFGACRDIIFTVITLRLTASYMFQKSHRSQYVDGQTQSNLDNLEESSIDDYWNFDGNNSFRRWDRFKSFPDDHETATKRLLVGQQKTV